MVGDGTQSFKGIDVDGAGLDADLLTSNIGGVRTVCWVLGNRGIRQRRIQSG